MRAEVGDAAAGREFVGESGVVHGVPPDVFLVERRSRGRD
jgi:hypothetical protein